MSTNILTTTQYAKEIKKCSRQAVVQAIKQYEKNKEKKYLLPSIIGVKKMGRDYLLEVAI